MSSKNKPNASTVETITKLIMSNKLAENNLATKHKSKLITQSIVDCIIALLTDGQSVMLKGYGSLSTHDKSERPGRNPKTGEPHLITARKVINFGLVPGNKNRAPKPKICSIIANLSGVSFETASTSFDIFLGYLGGVKDGHLRMELRGLGVFYYTERKGGAARNPKTGEEVLIVGTHAYLKFKASGLLLDSINGRSL
jgi:integration host factor subunit alpha